MNKKYFHILLPVLLSGYLSLAQAQDASPQQPVAESAPNLLEGIEIKKVSEIEPFLKDKRVGKIENYAQALAEVDEWLFQPGDELQVKALLEKEVNELRNRIETEIGRLTKSALDAPKGEVAAKHIMKITSLIMFYPSPTDEASRARLDKLTKDIADTSRRVAEIQHMRYNEWAIKRIQYSLYHYHQEVKLAGINNYKEIWNRLSAQNKDALIKKCIEGMSEIDPAFLEPVVMDLYNYAYGKTRDAMGSDENYLIKLANGFANPAIKRVTPSVF
jgi:hypothetical protein